MRKFYFINKNRKFVWHLPKLMKDKLVYTAKIKVHESWLDADQKCDAGHDKLWGIVLGHVHLNSSYRFTRKNFEYDGVKIIKVGYYAYIDGVSPQDNKKQKGLFTIDVKPNDILEMSIVRGNSYQMIIKNLSTLDMRTVELKKPMKHKLMRKLITMAYPNDKCTTDERTLFEINLNENMMQFKGTMATVVKLVLYLTALVALIIAGTYLAGY